MNFEEILEYLGYAASHGLQVRILLEDGTEVVGVPTSVDTHPAANEVFLQPLGIDDTEMGIGLGQISRVELA
jgi:hypothetical protein